MDNTNTINLGGDKDFTLKQLDDLIGPEVKKAFGEYQKLLKEKQKVIIRNTK